MLTVTAEISPVRCWIQEKFFYDLDGSYKDFQRCEIFAISSYRNRPLSLNVRILSHGGLFHDLPVWAAQTNQKLKSPVGGDLVYHLCPDNNITVNEFGYLKGTVWVKFEDRWVKGSYIATIDWHEDNYNIHFLSLETGEFCFMPSHKVFFSEDKPEKMPEYKKKRYSNMR